MKFDDIYNEALVNVATPAQNPAAPVTGTPTNTIKVPNRPPNIGLLTTARKKMTEGKPLTQQEHEEILYTLGNLPTDPQNPQQTNTPPVVQNPQPANKPQVTTNSPAI